MQRRNAIDAMREHLMYWQDQYEKALAEANPERIEQCAHFVKQCRDVLAALELPNPH